MWFCPFQNESKGKTRQKVSYYCTDENALRNMLVDADVVDWSTYFFIGGQFIYRWLSTVLYIDIDVFFLSFRT